MAYSVLKIPKRLIKWVLYKKGYTIVNVDEQYLEKILKNLDFSIVFDVGANEGQFARSLRYHGYTGRILSFEPTSKAHKELAFNAKFDSKWEVYTRVALGSENSVAYINIAGNSGLSSSLLPMKKAHTSAAPSSAFIGSEEVPVLALDDIYEAYIKNHDRILLKLDVQGYEEEVLRGAKSFIGRVQAIKIELSTASLYEGDKDFKYYIALLSGQGFELWDVETGFRDPTSGRLLQFDALFVKSDYKCS